MDNIKSVGLSMSGNKNFNFSTDETKYVWLGKNLNK